MDSKQSVVMQEQGGVAPVMPLPPVILAALPPKGACWYCDKPLDAVRRFCCKGCGIAYLEEAQYGTG